VVFHILTQPHPGTGLQSLPPILRIENQATITAYSKGA
jgi:hypothetical protein